MVTTQKYNIIIAGYIVGGPLGGLVWHHLQYVLGLHKTGHRVLFVEDSDNYPSCYNPQTHEISTDPSYGLKFINGVFSKFGLQHHWAYYSQHTNNWYGASKRQVCDFIQKADIFLNLSGVNPLQEIFSKIPVRVFIDTDPVFTQIRHLNERIAFDRANKHTHFYTYGESFGKKQSLIPDDGFDWQPTRQPVCLDAWKYSVGNKSGKWTTIMQWDSYKAREYKGQTFGMKSASFHQYVLLPDMVEEAFELAVGSPSAPRKKLAEAGWHLRNPLQVTATPDGYQKYIQQSKGEWSIAKQGYVAGHSGWFSERSTGYLASGRPVVVEDTGFSAHIETGRGLFAFTSPEEAIAAFAEVNANYEQHCKYAREIAEEYFRFDKVILALLQNCQRSVSII